MTAAKPPRTNGQAQPVWPATLAVLAVGGLHLSLPEPLTFGPSWLLLAVVACSWCRCPIARMRGSFALNQGLGYALLGVVTAEMLWSLFLLVRALPGHQLAPVVPAAFRGGSLGDQRPGLRVLVLASRCRRTPRPPPRGPHTKGDFLFPQMTLAPATQKPVDPAWTPGFVDYLFLAFNTSTAFSPTDSPVLSRWAKVFMMMQSSISLVTLALLAARAVNIL